MRLWTRSTRPEGHPERLSTTQRRVPGRRRRCVLESLEERSLLSTYTLWETGGPPLANGLPSNPVVYEQINHHAPTMTTSPPSTFVLSTARGFNVVNIENTSARVPIEVTGRGEDFVDIGSGNLQGILGGITVEGSVHASIDVDNTLDRSARTATLGNDLGSRVGAWGSITGLAPAEIDYAYAGTRNLEIDTGFGNDTVNIQATAVPTSVFNYGPATVNVGNNGSAQNILSPVFVSGEASTTLNVNDGADTTARTVTIDHDNSISVWGKITGLAPAVIEYADAYMRSVDITTGTAATTVNVRSTDVNTSIVHEGPATINFGKNGSVRGIHAPVTIGGSGAATLHLNATAQRPRADRS